MYDLLRTILNEQLSSVEFVQDYVQLRFDGNVLTCYKWPKVVINSKSYEYSTEGYRDALCKIISDKILDISIVDESHLEIQFENDHRIVLNLKRNESNNDFPELAVFTGIDNMIVVFD